MLRRLPADDGSSSRNSVAWRAGSYCCCAALAVAGLAHGRARPCALRVRSPMLDPLSAAALALSLIRLRRLGQPVRRLQLERERGKAAASTNSPVCQPPCSGQKSRSVRSGSSVGAVAIRRATGMGKSDAVQLLRYILSPRRSLSSADGRVLL